MKIHGDVKTDKFNKLRACKYLLEDVSNCDNFTRNKFRNTVDHLNAIRNAGTYISGCRNIGSYFELYHYLVQKDISSKVDITKCPEKVAGYIEDIDKKGRYSKDFVKALCAPFGYNLARFKALSINDLFDRNNPVNTKEDKN